MGTNGNVIAIANVDAAQDNNNNKKKIKYKFSTEYESSKFGCNPMSFVNTRSDFEKKNYFKLFVTQ